LKLHPKPMDTKRTSPYLCEADSLSSSVAGPDGDTRG
jgi:hypothetical protein